MIKIKLSAFADEAGNLIDEQISALRINGINGVELRSIDKKNVADFSINESKEYFKAFSDNGIEVWAIGSPLGKVDVDVDFDKYLEKVKRVCEIACVFHTDKIRMFSFFNAFDKKNKVVDHLSQMVEVGKSFGVSMCHENEKEVFGDMLERVLCLKNEVNGLKIIYDPANFVQVGEPADKTLELLHKDAEYFHIKDVIKDTDELVPAGCGDGKIDKLISMIDKDVTLTLEPHLALFDSFKSIDNTVMKHKFEFKDNQEAFRVATDSLKKLLNENGYKENKGVFIKGE